MSRSQYTDDVEDLRAWAMWRGAVASAIRGKRGQGLLGDLALALDSMPEKKLIAHELQAESGEVCALGAVGVRRGIDLLAIDAEEPLEVADAFGIAYALACEIAYINDEAGWGDTPEKRWHRVRAWVAENIRKPAGVAVSENTDRDER